MRCANLPPQYREILTFIEKVAVLHRCARPAADFFARTLLAIRAKEPLPADESMVCERLHGALKALHADDPRIFCSSQMSRCEHLFWIRILKEAQLCDLTEEDGLESVFLGLRVPLDLLDKPLNTKENIIRIGWFSRTVQHELERMLQNFSPLLAKALPEWKPLHT